MQNKINILLDLYGSYYPTLIDTEILLKALKNLPPEMELESKFAGMDLGLPPMKIKKTVGERIQELERQQKTLVARVEAIKEELEAIPGGAEALKNWKWSPPKI